MNTKSWIILTLLFLGITGIIYYSFNNNNDIPTGAADLPAGPIHWHPHLIIKINGQEQVIPANIGLGQVHAPTHTHAPDGIIHLENNKPTTKTLKLGYFFDVWGKTFSNECILDHCTDKGTLKMFVNGNENLDFENYLLRDKDEILIEYTTNK
ncbi:MAG TPA: hypothetical protein VFE88_00900 [Candidatus Nanoarchaeia archaeon]|nr:hypothetical protein [Candidatus Nanoarchaeia archaeon]